MSRGAPRRDRPTSAASDRPSMSDRSSTALKAGGGFTGEQGDVRGDYAGDDGGGAEQRERAERKARKKERKKGLENSG